MWRCFFSLILLVSLLVPVATVSSEDHVHSTHIQQKDVAVYITKTGKKYHKSSCRYLSRSQIKTTQKEAVKNGYEACEVCRP